MSDFSVKSQRVRVGGKDGKVIKLPLLQAPSVESALQRYGAEGVLVLINSGLRRPLATIASKAAAEGADDEGVLAAVNAFVPTVKVPSARGGKKSAATKIKEAVKAGKITQDQVDAFLAAQGAA